MPSFPFPINFFACYFFFLKPTYCSSLEVDYLIIASVPLKHILSICAHYLSITRVFDLVDGNGFKTSTMRLGADAIVFSRAKKGR